MHYPLDDGGGQGPFCPLDNNHSHFILVEPGSPGKGDGPTELRLRLEKYISEQRTGYGGESARGAGLPAGEGWEAVHGGGAARGGQGLPGTPWWGSQGWPGLKDHQLGPGRAFQPPNMLEC